MAASGLVLQRLSGNEITPLIWDKFYRFYRNTTGTRPYDLALTPHCRFFCPDTLFKTCGHDFGAAAHRCQMGSGVLDARLLSPIGRDHGALRILSLVLTSVTCPSMFSFAISIAYPSLNPCNSHTGRSRGACNCG